MAGIPITALVKYFVDESICETICIRNNVGLDIVD